MKLYFYPLKFSILLAVLLGCFFTTISIAGVNDLHAKKNKYISYTEMGQGEPIILIHAFPTDQQLWSPQQEDLKKYFRVITLDLWGFGYSEATDGKAITMTEYADEVDQLLNHLHIKNAIIAGESMGGYVALAFLKKYPEKVNGLVLSDTQSIADNTEMKLKREATAISVLQHGTTPLIDSFMPKALSSAAPEEKILLLKNILSTQTTTAIASALRGMALREDTSDALSNTILPILIVTGDQDTLIAPQQSQKMHELAKNSKLVTILNAGHLSSLEQPEQWNQAVVSMFYKKNNPQR